MEKGRDGRLLPILAAGLVLAALLISISMIILRVPHRQKFEDCLTSARMALEEGNRSLFRTQLLKASRHAVSTANWMSVLKPALEALPEDSSEDDYGLFTTLAGRAAAAIPGARQFSAYWIWGLLRSGDVEKARKHISVLGEDDWQSLRAEVNLRIAVGNSDSDIAAFVDKLETKSDPEFLYQSAALTQSAELSFDSSLLFMLNGNVSKAFDLAQTILNDERIWADDSNPGRYSVYTALAAIAYDAGNNNLAIDWLERGIQNSDRRRSTSWETLQFLGDLHWDKYLLQGHPGDLQAAGEEWSKAIKLVLPEDDGKDTSISASDLAEIRAELPVDSWSLWVNLSIQQSAAGNERESLKTLTKALVLFPDSDEVKAAWARNQSETEPALARRLIRDSGHNSPVLEITQIDINPDAVTPRLYEARLWELFNAVTSGDNIQDTDRRILTAFLLNYMSSRRNFSSVDVAIDRYLRVYPDEKWILSWRLASDAVRGVSLIDLIALTDDGLSPYEEFRTLALSEDSWRAIHDSSLFALMASNEIKEVLKSNLISNSKQLFSESNQTIEDAAILNILNTYRVLPLFRDTALGDRLEKLESDRESLIKSPVYRDLESPGKKGEIARAEASAILLHKSESLLRNALDDLSTLELTDLSLSDVQQADLLYLEALLLNNYGKLEESKERAREVLELTPEHAGARELLYEVR